VAPGTRRAEKKTALDSWRGLTLATTSATLSGPVLVPEGGTDTLAMAAGGLRVVGRPSASHTDLVIAWAKKHVSPGERIVLVGENDAKRDGRWPGLDDAGRAAQVIADALPEHVVMFALVPDRAKDSRQWLARRVTHEDHQDQWEEVGEQLKEKLLASAVVLKPGRKFDAAPFRERAERDESRVATRVSPVSPVSTGQSAPSATGASKVPGAKEVALASPAGQSAAAVPTDGTVCEIVCITDSIQTNSHTPPAEPPAPAEDSPDAPAEPPSRWEAIRDRLFRQELDSPGCCRASKIVCDGVGRKHSWVGPLLVSCKQVSCRACHIYFRLGWILRACEGIEYGGIGLANRRVLPASVFRGTPAGLRAALEDLRRRTKAAGLPSPKYVRVQARYGGDVFALVFCVGRFTRDDLCRVDRLEAANQFAEAVDAIRCERAPKGCRLRPVTASPKLIPREEKEKKYVRTYNWDGTPVKCRISNRAGKRAAERSGLGDVEGSLDETGSREARPAFGGIGIGDTRQRFLNAVSGEMDADAPNFCTAPLAMTYPAVGVRPTVTPCGLDLDEVFEQVGNPPAPGPTAPAVPPAATCPAPAAVLSAWAVDFPDADIEIEALDAPGCATSGATCVALPVATSGATGVALPVAPAPTAALPLTVEPTLPPLVVPEPTPDEPDPFDLLPGGELPATVSATAAFIRERAPDRADLAEAVLAAGDLDHAHDVLIALLTGEPLPPAPPMPTATPTAPSPATVVTLLEEPPAEAVEVARRLFRSKSIVIERVACDAVDPWAG
jgi:hypothetical protein